MGTVTDLLTSARYDLADYEDGIDYDDIILYNYLNRMIKIMDSQLAALGSDLVYATEEDIDTVADQNYIDLTNLNNGNWDTINSFWIGDDMKEKISIQDMYYKRKWYSGSQEPQYWANQGRRIIFEADADSAHTDVTLHYDLKHRPRLQDYTSEFTAVTATDILTLTSGNHTFITGDGPFTVSNDGGALPTGLSASTNYWCTFMPDDLDGMKLATSKDNALAGTIIDITATGSGTQTILMGEDYVPYDGIFDDLFREMLVTTSIGKKSGSMPDTAFQVLFRKRAFEETIRRGFVPKTHYIDF